MFLTNLLARVRACVAIFVIVAQGAAFNSTVELDVPFYALYFKERGVPHILSGSYGMAPVVGVAAACYLDIPRHLKRLCKKLSSVQYLLMLLALVVTAAEGLTSFIPVSHASTLQIPLLIALRVVLGAAVCWGFKIQIDCCKHFFPNSHEFVLGFAISGCYIGSAYSAALGGSLYSKFGFLVPYVALFGLNTSILVLNVAVLSFHIPEDRCSCSQDYVAVFDSQDSQDSIESGDVGSKSKLSVMTILPLMCNFVQMTIWGAVSCNLTMYLNEVAGLDESVGSRYLLLGSLVKMLACVTVGAIAKRKLLTPAQVMLICSAVTALGCAILFPDPHLTLISNNIQLVAYVGTALVGIGQAATDVAAVLSADSLNPSPSAKSLAICLVLVVGDTGIYSGHMLGAVIRKFVNYHLIGWVLCAVTSLALLPAVVLEVVNNRRL